jgi:hypothetical protein
VTLQRTLGHATATTTLNANSYLWPTAEDKTRKAAEAMMSEALMGKTRDSEDSSKDWTDRLGR